MIVVSPSPSRVVACSASARESVPEGRSGLGGGCAALRVDERLREGHVLGEREVADRLVAPQRSVEVSGGADEVTDHLVHVPFTAQERGPPLGGVEPLDLGEARRDAAAEDLSRIDWVRRIGVDAEAGRTVILCGAEHSATKVARGSRSSEGTQEPGGLLQARRFGRGRGI